jgi:hypothetical protein
MSAFIIMRNGREPHNQMPEIVRTKALRERGRMREDIQIPPVVASATRTLRSGDSACLHRIRADLVT